MIVDMASAMAENKISITHPGRKKGVSISKEKYDIIRKAVFECLKKRELTHTDLAECVSATLRGRFEGSIRWYVEWVKLDLEAKSVIERTPKTKPVLYRLKGTSKQRF